jgi:hypothetical protein
MQAATRSSSSGLSPRSRRIATFAVLLFGLSGLITGFAMGAFIRPKIPGITTNNGIGITPPVSQSTKAATKVSHENVTVGEPVITDGDFTYQEVANGSTTYTFSALIVADGATTPIRATDVTCKLWLTRDLDGTAHYLNANGYAVQKDINHIQQPFSHEALNTLNFASPARQTQPCKANGKTTWTYTLSTSAQPGTYYAFVLADWQGKHYNWYARAIIIKAD